MKTKVLDCTLRDGGYINNWGFPRPFVKDFYRAVSKSGVDFIEIGYRGTDKHFDPKKFGLWRFTPEDAINEMMAGVSGSPIALMVDYGKIDLSDIPDASKSHVALYRIAVHRDKILEAIELANAIAEKGYQTSLQIMGIARMPVDEIDKIIGPLEKSKVTFVYFADSYGSMMPSDMQKYISLLRKTNKMIGFHSHNNLQLAFANTLEAINQGIDIVDGSVYGMGRGAGNLPLETLITYLEKTSSENKYNVLPVLELIDQQFLKLAKEYDWGYNFSYMLSGMYEVHPHYASDLVAWGEYNIEDVQSVLKLINKIDPIGFDKNLITQILKTGFIRGLQIDSQDKTSLTNVGQQNVEYGPVTYKDRHQDRDFLILANGPSVISHKDKIKKFIEKYNPVVIASNEVEGPMVPDYHAFANKKNFINYVKNVRPESKLLLSRVFSEEFIKEQTDRDFELIQHADEIDSQLKIEEGIIKVNCRTVSILSVLVAIVMGAKRITIAGLDGDKDVNAYINRGLHFNVDEGVSREFSMHLEVHNFIDALLKQINDYLISNGLNDVIILTPTSHRSFYKDIDSFLE